MRCPNCDFALETGTCPECGKDNVTEAKFCNWCGQELPRALSDPLEVASSRERLACPDGMCIGIIGEDGLCVICGKSYSEPPGPDNREKDGREETETEETGNPGAADDQESGSGAERK
ncbi:MAG: zinc ribbon domain-containing protein [Desulfarculales bacterium]|jgi:hypothetical protein|nr:zinc ribbon domain-containing protein [Desulfarculales bacterium]